MSTILAAVAFPARVTAVGDANIDNPVVIYIFRDNAYREPVEIVSFTVVSAPVTTIAPYTAPG